MRLSVIQAVFLKELREMLRDRRSLLIMFGVPLLLYPLITVLVGNLGLSRQKQLQDRVPAVVVENPAAAPGLVARLDAPGAAVRRVELADPRAALARGEVDAVITVPDDFERDALAIAATTDDGDDAPATTTTAPATTRPTLAVHLDRSRTPTLAAERRVRDAIDAYERWVMERRLAARGVGRAALAPVDAAFTDIATADQRLGKLLATMLPLLVLVTGMLGAFFPAINATTTERELGTLETLLVTPAGRAELLIAKAALVLLTGLLTAAVNLVSMSVVLWQVASQAAAASGPGAAAGLGSLAIKPAALVVTFLAAVPTLVFFAALVLTLGMMARTYREANAMATPVMLIPLASIVVGILEPEPSPGLLVTPIANTTLIIREALIGRVTAGAFVLATASSLVYAGLMLGVAGRLFSSEQLVNPSWEPVSLAGLRQLRAGLRDPRRRRRRLPTVDEALALFCASLLLFFYVGPNVARYGLFPALLTNQLLLILAPTLLAAWALGWDWRETFSLRRPTVVVLAAATVVGLGLPFAVRPLGLLQEHVWPRSPEAVEQLKALAGMIERSLRAHPLLTVGGIALLAGTCEELLFRGPVQRGLMRALPAPAAVVVAAVLFAGMHLDLHGMPIRTALGVLLGAVVVRTKSIVPAMVIHFLYDAGQLGYAAHLVFRHPETTSLLTLDAARAWTTTDTLLTTAGVLATAGGLWALLRQAVHPAPPDEPRHQVGEGTPPT